MIAVVLVVAGGKGLRGQVTREHAQLLGDMATSVEGRLRGA